MLKAFHVVFLKTMWVKLIFWDRPCDHWPCSESSPPTPNPPRTSAEDGVSIYSPRSRCISHCCYQKRPQGGSTSRSALLLAKLIFIFSWSRVDFRCCACFRFTGTWFNYIENCIYSFSGLPQGGSFRVFGRLLCVIQEVLLDYLSDNTL